MSCPYWSLLGRRSSRCIPELDANNRPCSACPRCNGGSFWRFRHSETLWFCIDCYAGGMGACLDVLWRGEAVTHLTARLHPRSYGFERELKERLERFAKLRAERSRQK